MLIGGWIVMLSAGPEIGHAETLTVDEVVRQVRAQDDAINDQTADVDIQSVGADGAERSTTLRLYWKNPRGTKGMLGQTLLVTLAPQNRKGESFLLWQTERASDSQAWLYLPDLRQALRITIPGQDAQRPQGTADMLLGFEQLGARLLAEGDRSIAGRAQLDGAEHVVLDERVAGEPATTRRFFVSLDTWTIGKIEYRDVGGRVHHTQTIRWQRIGRAWVWHHVEVRAIDPPGRTIVDLRNVKVNTGLSDRMFTVNTLKSGSVP